MNVWLEKGKRRRLGGLLIGLCLCMLSTTAIASDLEESTINETVQDTMAEQKSDYMERAVEIENQILLQEGIDPNSLVSTLSGRPTVADVFGMDGGIYMDWLKSHENDGYYLGTPNVGDDWRSPNGDIAFNGSPGLNCTGFVWHALMFPTYLSHGNTSMIPAMTGWVDLYRTYDIERQYFPSKEDMLQSGYLQKGDIIWVFNGSEDSYNSTHHIAIYWGNGHEDIVWESLGGVAGVNEFAPVTPTNSINLYVALKVGGYERADVPTEDDKDGFRDIKEDAWYYPYVMDVFEKGLMTGKDPKTFAPAEELSRGQFITVLYRMYGQPETAFAEKFSDVKDGAFYSIPVTWGSNANVITGYADGKFGPEDSINREQMITMLMRYAEMSGRDVSSRTDYSAFPDAADVSDFAKDAMEWAVAEGIISGDQGKLNPHGKVSRAVCATMISRFNAE